MQGIAIARADGEPAAQCGRRRGDEPVQRRHLRDGVVADVQPDGARPALQGVEARCSTRRTRSHPAYDKAFQGTYPAGSTFKPITATAAFESGVLAPGQRLDCPGSSLERATSPSRRRCSTTGRRSRWGRWTCQKALEVSCDTFFYQLGDEFYGRDAATQFQSWIRQFGYGTAPPLDAGGAQAGVVPDPAVEGEQNVARNAGAAGDRAAWDPGDDINMSIGQGNLLVSPLQQAVAYSALENGGNVVTPHVGEDHPPARARPRWSRAGASLPAGAAPQPLADAPGRDQAGLYGATHAGDGTSAAIFGSFPPDRVRQDRHRRGARPPPARTAPTPGGRAGRRRATTRSSSSRSSTTAATAASSAAPVARERVPGVLRTAAPLRWSTPGPGPVAMTHYLRHLDYLMLATALSISAFGLWIMQTVSRHVRREPLRPPVAVRGRRARSACSSSPRCRRADAAGALAAVRLRAAEHRGRARGRARPSAAASAGSTWARSSSSRRSSPSCS